MSSRRLLTLLEHLPEDSEFKTNAERGGRWPSWKNMLAEAANMQYRSLAWYLAFHSTDDTGDLSFDPADYEFVDPAVQEQRDEAEKRAAEQAAQTEPELVEAGWM